ncbi:unnamed protein product [Colias eurytheme]|nr:unnamed protein product [Colias eurytheme]
MLVLVLVSCAVLLPAGQAYTCSYGSYGNLPGVEIGARINLPTVYIPKDQTHTVLDIKNNYGDNCTPIGVQVSNCELADDSPISVVEATSPVDVKIVRFSSTRGSFVKATVLCQKNCP